MPKNVVESLGGGGWIYGEARHEGFAYPAPFFGSWGFYAV